MIPPEPFLQGSSLRPFKEHPFQVKDDKEMFLLQESIEKYGILNPLRLAILATAEGRKFL